MKTILIPLRATIPTRLFANRSVLVSSLFSACCGFAIIVHAVYLPFYFQSVKGTTAVESGIRLLPYCISMSLGVCVTGFMITRYGQYVPLMILGGAFVAIGSGLLYTLHVNTSFGEWFGYQVVAAFGLGLGVQIPYLVIHNVLSAEDVPTGSALIIFSQNFAGAVAITIAQNIVSHNLQEQLSKIPGVDAAKVIAAGATEIRKNVDVLLLPRVLEAYNFALMRAFILPIAAGGGAFIVSFGMEWKNIKEESKGTDRGAASPVGSSK